MPQLHLVWGKWQKRKKKENLHSWLVSPAMSYQLRTDLEWSRLRKDWGSLGQTLGRGCECGKSRGRKRGREGKKEGGGNKVGSEQGRIVQVLLTINTPHGLLVGVRTIITFNSGMSVGRRASARGSHLGFLEVGVGNVVGLGIGSIRWTPQFSPYFILFSWRVPIPSIIRPDSQLYPLQSTITFPSHTYPPLPHPNHYNLYSFCALGWSSYSTLPDMS